MYYKALSQLGAKSEATRLKGENTLLRMDSNIFSTPPSFSRKRHISPPLRTKTRIIPPDEHIEVINGMARPVFD